MPTTRYGGLWPAEWILLFERWINEKFPRLEPYKGTYKVTFATLRKRDRIWFERFTTSDSPREYHVYREPGSGDPNVQQVTIDERFPRVFGTVIVNDSDGRHELAIP